MPVLKFHTPEAEAHYQSLLAAHGKEVLHHALRIHPHAHTLFFLPGEGDLQVSSESKAAHTGTGWNGRLNRLENHSFTIRDHTETGKGFGTKTVARQVLAARKLGIPTIHITDAIRSTPEGRPEQASNGYYTWPRLGFNAPLPSFARTMFPGHRDWHSVMADPENAELWKQHGRSLADLTFDTHPDSPHSKALLAYMKQKGIKV